MISTQPQRRRRAISTEQQRSAIVGRFYYSLARLQHVAIDYVAACDDESAKLERADDLASQILGFSYGIVPKNGEPPPCAAEEADVQAYSGPPDTAKDGGDGPKCDPPCEWDDQLHMCVFCDR